MEGRKLSPGGRKLVEGERPKKADGVILSGL